MNRVRKNRTQGVLSKPAATPTPGSHGRNYGFTSLLIAGPRL